MDPIYLLRLKTILERNIPRLQQMTKWDISSSNLHRWSGKDNILTELLKFHIAERFIQVKEEFQCLVLVAEIDTPPSTIVRCNML